MIEILKKNPRYIYLAGLVLLIPALLVNLGRLNIFMAVDEATRALVALEMMISENFVTPTINGEFYYNKPPLFNWILIAFYRVFGIDEFVLRLPTAISMVGFGFTIYYFVKQELGSRAGVITAFMFVSAGRLLFWESLLGYIDTTFSWVVYSGMMFIYHFLKQKKYLSLFVVSYIFMAFGFMLKGLPAIVFQGITLLVAFTAAGNFSRLFSWKHLVGGLFFLIPVGSYYLIYHQFNSVENVFNTLWHESAQRTVVDQGWVLTFQHLYRFPVEMLYHYLPWTLMLVFTFKKGFWKVVRANSFIRFNLLVVLFNILPYWSSPDVYPKYIMMLVPMIYTVLAFFYLESFHTSNKLRVVFESVLMIAAAILTAGYLVLPFVPAIAGVSMQIAKVLLLFVLSGVFVYLMIRLKKHRVVIFAIVLIVGRLAFDWFIWPQRAAQWEKFENASNKVAEITGDEAVKYFRVPMLQWGGSYYMSLAKWQIIGQEKNDPESDVFYITDDAGLQKIRSMNNHVKIYYDYPNVQDGRTLHLVKIFSADNKP